MCLYISTTAHMSSVHKLGFHECLEEKCKCLFLKQKHSISFIIKEQGQQATTTTHTSHQISLSHHIKQKQILHIILLLPTNTCLQWHLLLMRCCCTLFEFAFRIFFHMFFWCWFGRPFIGRLFFG